MALNFFNEDEWREEWDDNSWNTEYSKKLDKLDEQEVINWFRLSTIYPFPK